MASTDAQLQQEVEILAGRRPGGPFRGQAAVRFDDLAGMVDLPDTLLSDYAAANPPTKAEFDLLVRDVHGLFANLRAVSASIQKRRNLK